MARSTAEDILLRPIGIIRTPYVDKYAAPRQPGSDLEHVIGTITLFPGRNFEQALSDLDGFEKIWIISWFDRNTAWKPKVLPPRGGRIRRGVFSTRSPHRPNPIGLSLCTLLDIRGRKLRVENPDLLDRTPILDLKPYIPYADAFPNAGAGWVDEIAQGDEHEVIVSPTAARQATWVLENHGIELLAHARRVLARDPEPHPYRRTKEVDSGGFVLAMKSWRIHYRIDYRQVVVERISNASGIDVPSLL